MKSNEAIVDRMHKVHMSFMEYYFVNRKKNLHDLYKQCVTRFTTDELKLLCSSYDFYATRAADELKQRLDQ